MILGKFMPPHAGHEYLVQFARGFVNRLTVLVCSLESEPIPGELRCQWMRELFPDVRVVHVTEDLPQTPAEHPRFWDIWRRVVRQAVGEPIDYVFASEDYGHRLAAELDATFVPVDLSRTHVPISAAQIRASPLAHWEFIPACVRPYFVRRVCLFGPESTGKSTLAAQLAAHYRTVHVPEFARGWLDPKQGVCAAEDIPIIARGQLAAEDALARQANRLLLCDTDLLLTTIWSDVLFGDCPSWIRELAASRHYDLYLLLDIDAPWIDDAQRFLAHRRQEFFDRCRTLLDRTGRPYVTIRGPWPARFAQACEAVDRLSR
jgi:HTH-type transcriptional repressor of NAD biosynthesis genes